MANSMAKVIVPWIVTVGFLICGIVCLIFPKRIQKKLLRSEAELPSLLKWYPPVKHIARESYVRELRSIGAMTLAVGLYCIWLLCGGSRF